MTEKRWIRYGNLHIIHSSFEELLVIHIHSFSNRKLLYGLVCACICVIRCVPVAARRVFWQKNSFFFKQITNSKQTARHNILCVLSLWLVSSHIHWAWAWALIQWERIQRRRKNNRKVDITSKNRNRIEAHADTYTDQVREEVKRCPTMPKTSVIGDLYEAKRRRRQKRTTRPNFKCYSTTFGHKMLAIFEYVGVRVVRWHRAGRTVVHCLNRTKQGTTKVFNVWYNPVQVVHRKESLNKRRR